MSKVVNYSAVLYRPHGSTLLPPQALSSPTSGHFRKILLWVGYVMEVSIYSLLLLFLDN